MFVVLRIKNGLEVVAPITGVDFTNIFLAAFALADPKSTKRH